MQFGDKRVQSNTQKIVFSFVLEHLIKSERKNGFTLMNNSDNECEQMDLETDE